MAFKLRKNALKSVRSICLFVLILSIITVNFSSFRVSALTDEKLDFFAKNNILFYNPDEYDCEPVSSNGIYPGAKYSFTDDQLRRLWWAAIAEQSSSVEATKTELSFFANLYESKGGTPGNSEGVIKKILERWHAPGHDHGWFASTTGEAYETGGVKDWDEKFKEPTAEEIAIVRDILNNGNRTIPKEIDEHDSISDIVSVSNNGVSFEAREKSKYQSGVTKIKNDSGSTYTFYFWANLKKECGDDEKCGDPFGYTGSAPSESYSTLTQKNYNTKYDGTEVLNNEVLQQIQDNKKVYQTAVSGTNIPWQVLAAIHFRESNAAIYNPNGQGVYQIVSGNYTVGAITEEEFLEQSKTAVEFIKNKIGNLDLSNDDNVKRLFFLYNGADEKYIEKAKKMGFSDEQASNGEGSPYVMNLFDEKRDPNSSNMSPFWPGRYTGDGQYDETSTEIRPGAYLVYKALGGGENTEVCSTNYSSVGELIAKTALDLSWEGKKKHDKEDPKPEYVAAMKEVGAYFTPCSATVCAPKGASCDQFVATVMRFSGADENYKLYGADASGNYMKEHKELYSEVNYDGTNPEVLQPGDIFATYNSSGHGHIWIYVEIDGKMGRADASFNDRTAEHYTISNAPPITDQDGSRHYRVYRRLDT